MNWLVFAIVTYVLVAVQHGLGPLWTIGGAHPMLGLILLVFVGLFANSLTVAWAAVVLGLVVDLQPGPIPGAVILGPAALGYLMGAYAVVQLRNLLFRESPLTLAIMTFVVGIFVQLVIVAAYTLRGVPFLTGAAVPDWSVANQLFTRFLDLLYTSLAALPIGFLLMRSVGVWRFPGKNKARGER